MITQAQDLQSVVETHLSAQLFANPDENGVYLYGRYNDLNDEEFDGISGSFSLDLIEVQTDDLLTLYGSLDDHIDQGYGVVVIAGPVNEGGYYFDPYSSIENEVNANVEFYATMLVDYSTGVVVDSDISYGLARDKFTDESTLTELQDGIVLYELNAETNELFGFDAPAAGATALVPLEDLTITDEPDPLVLTGTREDDILKGEDGDDTLIGYNGDDKLIGNDGDDVLKGGNGNDDIRGGNGDNAMFGNSGDDFLLGLSGADRLLGGGGDDALHGGHGNDKIYGHNGDDTLFGGRDDDLLFAGKGDDDLFGGNGDDILSGGDGDDILDGGRNDDTLNGGAEDNLLTGGHGDDVFVIGGEDGTAIITDFTLGEDKLDLKGFSGDLADLFLSEEDSAVRLQWDNTVVTLENLTEEDLSEADFLI